ncbi:LysE family translocator [Paraneptunicella aestuarii]|uniref:LysE family translocator n=1 Tax=Paraneptunicella aestuarii TaxID=2831148 RepID=UPI001E41A19C|nr:LysE family translocator [Paraneptunicella aestuarii]UAA40778.1 LysE family translocator [Paraneptunicella aestuarii]
MQNYWVEFVTIATVHLFAVASPGPDFAVVLKHSVSFGRRAAMITSIGIGLGILVHVTYSLLGIGLLIKTTPWLFQLFSYLAAGYLVYLGLGALRSRPQHAGGTGGVESEVVINDAISDRRAFWIGLLTNGLNPKATLFFLTLFAVVISAQTPNSVKVIYGLYLAFATGLWFCALSYFLSSQKVRGFIREQGFWFDRIMGLVLIGLALKLVISGI